MRLAASLRYGVYAATALLFASGAGWLMAHYLFAAGRLPDGFAAVAIYIHGAAAMVMLVLTGSAVALHIPVAWRERRNRPSGLVLSALLTILVVTGYLLYYVGGEAARAAASAGHWMLGVAAPLAFAGHAWLGRAAV